MTMVFLLEETHVLEMDFPSLAILLLPVPALWTLQGLHLLPCTGLLLIKEIVSWQKKGGNGLMLMGALCSYQIHDHPEAAAWWDHGMVSEDSLRCHPERMELFLTGCCI